MPPSAACIECSSVVLLTFGGAGLNSAGGQTRPAVLLMLPSAKLREPPSSVVKLMALQYSGSWPPVPKLVCTGSNRLKEGEAHIDFVKVCYQKEHLKIPSERACQEEQNGANG